MKKGISTISSDPQSFPLFETKLLHLLKGLHSCHSGVKETLNQPGLPSCSALVAKVRGAQRSAAIIQPLTTLCMIKDRCQLGLPWWSSV